MSDKPQAWVNVIVYRGRDTDIYQWVFVPGIPNPWCKGGTLFWREIENNQFSEWRVCSYGPYELKRKGVAEHLVSTAREWAKEAKEMLRAKARSANKKVKPLSKEMVCQLA